MSTQILQLNHAKGASSVANKSEVVPAAQGGDCASSPAGITYIPRPTAEAISYAGINRSTRDCYRALDTLRTKRFGQATVVYRDGDLRAAQEATYRRARKFGMHIKTRVNKSANQLHIFNMDVIAKLG